MFFFGENQPPPAGDYRPEVHDSDGLSLLTGEGEWIWRPLVNPKRLLVTTFGTTNPRGFGLMQRDRAFSSYQDPDGRLELRPSAWITPMATGVGHVELVQIPTPDESNDNIVAYWVPDGGIARASTGSSLPPPRLADERRDPAAAGLGDADPQWRAPGEGENEIWLRVDFAGPALAALSPDAAVKADFSIDPNGELIDMTVRRNDSTAAQHDHPHASSRRRQADEVACPAQGVSKDGKPALLSETWSYILPGE